MRFLSVGWHRRGSCKQTRTKCRGLKKCSIVKARLCKHLSEFKNHKLCFDNWFTSLLLLQYLKMEGIYAVGTIRANHISNCPILPNKDLEKAGQNALDYKSDSNSGLIDAKWVDNKVVQLYSCCAGFEPMSTIQRNKTKKLRVPIQCPSIVMLYNKNIGGLDLANMLIALY